MNFKDFFKKSVWNSFSANNGITLDFVVQAAIAMTIAVILGILIYFIYKHYYGGVVYSNSFAVTLIGMTVLTCALTLAISSNVVISLGMVGALSIVRYRTAIKDPMDLLYLFWSISVGITTAANLYVLAVLTMIVLTLIVQIFYKMRKRHLIYILVVHYTGEATGAEVIRNLGRMRYQIRSKTMRKDMVELTVELMTQKEETVFLDHINALEQVRDASLIAYNGEYNG